MPNLFAAGRVAVKYFLWSRQLTISGNGVWLGGKRGPRTNEPMLRWGDKCYSSVVIDLLLEIVVFLEIIELRLISILKKCVKCQREGNNY